MKLKVPFLMPALFSVWVFSSEKAPIIKVHAYSQAITRGIDPGKGVINENGTEERQHVKPGIQYLIYLEQPGTASIKPELIWIHGVGYSINSVIVTKTPVVLENQEVYGESKKNILVQKTSNKVIQLILTGISDPPANRPATVKKLIAASDLVVSYFWKGKRYYAGVKKIKMLEPVAAM